MATLMSRTATLAVVTRLLSSYNSIGIKPAVVMIVKYSAHRLRNSSPNPSVRSSPDYTHVPALAALSLPGVTESTRASRP